MCVLAVFLGLDPERPLVVAANRDEFYGRPSQPPQVLNPGVLGPRDLQGGGTWLAVNEQGLFAAVTNRRAPAKTADSRSRGLLVLEAMNCRTVG